MPRRRRRRFRHVVLDRLPVENRPCVSAAGHRDAGQSQRRALDRRRLHHGRRHRRHDADRQHRGAGGLGRPVEFGLSVRRILSVQCCVEGPDAAAMRAVRALHDVAAAFLPEGCRLPDDRAVDPAEYGEGQVRGAIGHAERTGHAGQHDDLSARERLPAREPGRAEITGGRGKQKTRHGAGFFVDEVRIGQLRRTSSGVLGCGDRI
ncbi:hypothetical protein F01_230114 [Burkholderia cenocepacia]|nr:hypothetical protein F01_230114 [Burkholderia cenocepacia]